MVELAGLLKDVVVEMKITSTTEMSSKTTNIVMMLRGNIRTAVDFECCISLFQAVRDAQRAALLPPALVVAASMGAWRLYLVWEGFELLD